MVKRLRGSPTKRQGIDYIISRASKHSNNFWYCIQTPNRLYPNGRVTPGSFSGCVHTLVALKVQQECRVDKHDNISADAIYVPAPLHQATITRQTQKLLSAYANITGLTGTWSPLLDQAIIVPPIRKSQRVDHPPIIIAQDKQQDTIQKLLTKHASQPILIHAEHDIIAQKLHEQIRNSVENRTIQLITAQTDDTQITKAVYNAGINTITISTRFGKHIHGRKSHSL